MTWILFTINGYYLVPFSIKSYIVVNNNSIISEKKATSSKPIWSTRLSEEKSFDRQDSGLMTVSSLSKADHQITPTVNFSTSDQHFTQDAEKVAKTFDFDESAKPEKGILSKSKMVPKRIDSVVNEVFIDKRPKFKRQESIISGFDIQGIEEEEERGSSPAPPTFFDNPTFINMDGQ